MMVFPMTHSRVDDFRHVTSSMVTSSMVILLLGHYLVLPAGLEPVPLRSQQMPSTTSTGSRIDEYPASLHLAVAYTSRTEAVAIRTVNRTLQLMAPELATMGVTLTPLYTALGDRFSASVLTRLCETWNSSTVLAAIVMADHLPGLLPTLAAVSSGVPVLWATGHVRHGYLEPASWNHLDLRVEVGSREMMQGLRSLLLQAHWHTFTMITAAPRPLPSAALRCLHKPPLQPLHHTLRPDASNTNIFRILSDISRATKGVVVLISDGKTAKRVMAEAERLNMVAGNFVWIWIDSNAHVKSREAPLIPTLEPSVDHVTQSDNTARRRKIRDSDKETETLQVEIESILNSVIDKQQLIKYSDSESKNSRNSGKNNRFHKNFESNRKKESKSEKQNHRNSKRDSQKGSESTAKDKNSIRNILDFSKNNSTPNSTDKNSNSSDSNSTGSDSRLSNGIGKNDGNESSGGKFVAKELEKERNKPLDGLSSVELTSTAINAKDRRVEKDPKKLNTPKLKVIDEAHNKLKGGDAISGEMGKDDRFTGVKIIGVSTPIDDTHTQDELGHGDVNLLNQDHVPSQGKVTSGTPTLESIENSDNVHQKHSSSNEGDDYKEYLCSSSSRVHDEHKQDEICREFRIKKHQLMETIRVREEEKVNNLRRTNGGSSKNRDFLLELATLQNGGNTKTRENVVIVGVKSTRVVDEHSVNSDGEFVEVFDDSRRTSSKLTSDTSLPAPQNITIIFRRPTETTNHRSRSVERRSRRNAAKSSSRNSAKSAGSKSLFPAKSLDDVARENVTTHEAVPLLPVGLLAIRPVPFKIDRHFVRSAVRTVVEALKRAILKKCQSFPSQPPFLPDRHFNCWNRARRLRTDFTDVFSRELRTALEEALAGKNSGANETGGVDRLAAKIQILNLVPEKSHHNATDQQKKESQEWKCVGEIVGHSAVRLDSIVWPGGHLVPASTPKGARSVFRVVTAMAPPFVMEGELDEDGQCLRGLECHRLLTSDKDNLTLVFNEMDRLEDTDPRNHLWGISYPRYKYVTSCCYGLAMDLLENVAEELEFDFHLYVVADGMHGSRRSPNQWNGVVGDLMSGAAHMSFAALSVNSPRSEVIDFSVPYFFSGVSLLAAPKQRTDIPLLAFLLPFSPELWIAIFTSLNVTAVAVAIYEWLSPFGLNPWGRQRSKNFSMSSAMWVCWGLLCGHLVAFKAPKSWPNKFLINVWGGFSVIFVASYTANIAALIAGLFFHNAVGDYHDRSLLSQRVATPKASAADYYIHKANQMLWDHVQKYSVTDVAEGVKHLKNGTLDILIADTPILDYYRATDNGCKLQKFGDTINEDTYAVGMTKGFPLKDSISAVMAKYSSNGYMDILQEKWYGGLPCFKLATEMAQPRPLGVAAVAGVFLLLGLGMVVGCLILLAEHLFYRYTLPILRHKPKGTIWRSRNIMFFSQKLYRFINCVELVSPHHAARELVHTIRQGQITSLFQKSVKRKEHEQRRRRRSKAQFFEMIQEIRRVQQEERVSTMTTPHLSLTAGEGGRSPRSKKLQHSRSPQFLSPPDQHRRNSRLPSRLELARRLSRDVFRSKSSGNLRRMSSDISMGRLLDCHSSQAIGRRLSRDTNLSPPDINSRRASYLSDGRRVPSTDIGSVSDLTAPKSPNYLTTTSIPTVRSIPDYTTRDILTPTSLLPPRSPADNISKFSYIDIKSPSFKTKLTKLHEPAGLSLSLADKHPTSWTSSFSEVNPRVIVCGDENNQGNTSSPPVSTTKNDQNNPQLVEVVQKQKQRTNTSMNSTEHMIQIIIPPDDTNKGEVSPAVPAASIRSSTPHVADQKAALNLVLDELKERCKEVNAASCVDVPSNAPKIVSYIPKKPVRKSLETVQRSLDDATATAGVSTAEKRKAVEQRGRSLDRPLEKRSCDHSSKLPNDATAALASSTDKPVKKERRRVHKVRSSEFCERMSGGETIKCVSHVGKDCGKCCASDRTRERRPLTASRSSDEATATFCRRSSRDDLLSQIPESDLKRHQVAVTTSNRNEAPPTT